MSFAKINEVLDMPNLIEVQKNSYKWFLEEGLREVFTESTAITDYNGNLVLDFIGYRLEETPKYTVQECKERDVTYAAPIYVRVRLTNKQTGEILSGSISAQLPKWNFAPFVPFESMPQVDSFILGLTEQCNLRCTYTLRI